MIAQIQYNGQQVTVSVDWELQFSGDYHIKAVYFNGNDITEQLTQEETCAVQWALDEHVREMDFKDYERKQIKQLNQTKG